RAPCPGFRADGGRHTLLLHSCCAPCVSSALETLAEAFDMTLYYYNPNIHPEAEYLRRLSELRRFAAAFPPARSAALVEASYDPADFYRATNALNEPELRDEPERGTRCSRCYRFRLEQAFRYAAAGGFAFVATTLSASPHKDARAVNAAGQALEAQFCAAADGAYPHFLAADFKKRDGYARSLELSREYGLYRQRYCGCVYSVARAPKTCGKPGS
ncbi:epoxyqueuosine reductase QueH, partial [Treponema endosymbiont of Eucomonympha sp.]|uniref:epoxyqueuosine reductase QueH n=1 Tax=Treponema endosymbiont of Eucomonympha sp. TaxID=1580831 RepID=UPI0007507E46